MHFRHLRLAKAQLHDTHHRTACPKCMAKSFATLTASWFWIPQDIRGRKLSIESELTSEVASVASD